MSYDVTLVAKGPGEDWDAALERMEENAALDRPLSEGRRQAWRAAADRILEIDSGFELHDDSELLEMTHAAYGMTVSMFELEAGVSVAYWHTGDESDRIMKIAGEVVDVLKAASGWSVWDPQLGRELRTGAELAGDGAGTMSDVTQRIPTMIQASMKETRSVSVPWWKFWVKRGR